VVGTLPTTRDGYRALRQVARQWPDRIWAIEGANGTGRPLAQRLLADGERVLDVPAKLAARARVFDTGQGRKTDATDAHAVVMVALRDGGLRELTVDDELVVLRMLCDRRDELSKARAQGLNRMHRLLTELVPGGVPTKKSVSQYRAMLAGVRPRDQLGRTRRRLAADLLAELAQIEARLTTLKAELKQAVLARGSDLMNIYGIGPAGAARILADVGEVARFPDRNHFASWTGTAPIDASSGEQIRHRLSRAGNRRLNHVLYMAAFVQLRHDTDGRAYYRRKLTAGKTPMEAMRCLIGGVSAARPGQMSGRGSRSCRGMASLPRPVRASLSSATSGAPRPPTGVRNMPDRGPNNEEPARGPRHRRVNHRLHQEATDDRRRLGLGKPHPRCDYSGRGRRHSGTVVLRAHRGWMGLHAQTAP